MIAERIEMPTMPAVAHETLRSRLARLDEQVQCCREAVAECERELANQREGLERVSQMRDELGAFLREHGVRSEAAG